VAFAGARLQPRRWLVLDRRRTVGLRGGRLAVGGVAWLGLGRLGCGFAQAGAVGQHDALDRLTQVGPQMPSVSYLDRFRSASARALGVGPRAVPANDLHPGMVAQPVGQHLRRALLDQINRAVGEDVDQDGAIGLTTADREIVDAEHLNITDRRVGQRADQPQQTVPTGRHAQHHGQTRTGPPGQRQPDRLQHSPQQTRTPSVLASQTRNLLDERPPSAVGVATEKPAHAQLDYHRPRTDRGIGQPASIAAVYSV
jgi:hypothetical protein